jgi:hypothetical protein
LATASHTVRRTAGVAVEQLFDTVVAEDVLPKVLQRWGPIPAVTGTRGLTGPWDTPGSQRTVLLEHGGSAREEVLLWERPVRFEYRVDRITGPLGRLVDHAIGSWEFSVHGPGSSSFRWTYSFVAHGLPGAVVLSLLVHTAWARYMAQCADLSVRLASAGDAGA